MAATGKGRSEDARRTIAELRVQLDARTAERDEAEAQKAAIAEVLQIINASPGYLAPVFDAILAKAHSLCGAAYGALVLRDGETFRAVATHSYAGTFAEQLRQGYRGAENPITRSLIDGERFVHIPDLARIDHPMVRASVEQAGVRTGLYVPLRKDDALLGMISSCRSEIRPFSDKEIGLLQNFAAQAVIAIENARLMTETREALEQQTATAEVLGVINSSPGDLAPVFEAILDKALQLCSAAFGIFWTCGGEQMHAVAHRGLSAAHAEFISSGPHDARADVLYRLFLEGRDFVHADAAAGQAYQEGEPLTRAFVDLGGGRSVLSVPLRKDDILAGFLVIYRQEVRPFTDKQIALLQNFAAQAVIAMENARLLTETREALEQQTATAEVLGVINSSPGDLAPVFDALLQKATRLCGATYGSIYLYDGKFFQTVAAEGDLQYTAILRDLGRFSPSRSITLERIVNGAGLVHVANIADDEVYRAAQPEIRAQADLSGMRTLLTVALRKDDALLGTISVYRQEVRPFTEKQIALLQNFAAQAVIAIENARLLTETREALERQTATAEVLGVINSSPGDLAPVFDAMLEKAMQLCEASFGGLWTFDDERYVATALRGVPDAYARFLAETTVMPGPGSAPYRFRKGERSVIQNLDLADEEPYRVGDRQRRALVDLGGARTALQVPLVRDDVALGVITIYRQEVRPFSDKQIALLQNFAAQAVIAMENARLLTETREALDQQTATAEVLQVINSSPGDLAPVFEAMLEKAMRLCEAAFGLMSTYDGENLHSVARHGVPPALAAFLESAPPPPGPHSLLNRIIGGEDAAQVADLSKSQAYLNREPRPVAIVEQGGARTYAIVALRKDGKLLGTISVYRQEVRPFSDKQIALLQNFAAQAVIAMENARLITETREALEQQTATAEVLGVINSSPGDLAPVFDALVEKAMRLCDAAHGALRTFDGELFNLVSAHGDYAVEQARRLGAIPPGGLFDPIVRGERVVHIVDVRETSVYRDNPAFRQRLDIGRVRTWLAVSLQKDGIVLGAIIVFRQEVRPFTDKQIALLQNFAAQAVIAMENARLITETREALERQTATAEVLQVINASPGDLAPVFDAMLEKAMRLCEASGGALRSYDGDAFHAVAVRGVPAAFGEATREVRSDPTTALGRIEHGERMVQIADLADPELPHARSRRRREMVELGGIRTALWVALRKEEKLLGTFVLYRSEVRPFPEKQIALVENFAAQAVIAMENARLLTETREALERQSATAEVLGVINSSPGDLKPVFDAILEKARAFCGAAHGSLSLFDGETLRAVAINTPSEEFRERLRQGRSAADLPLIRPLFDGAPFVHFRDLAELDHPAAREAVALTGVRTALFVPLRKDEVLLGLISTVRMEVRPFSDKEIALLQNFAAQAVVAMENARLLSETREALEQQTATAEVLQVINSSPGDLAPVFDAMLEKAMHLCEAAFGGLATFHGDTYRVVATHNLPQPARDVWQGTLPFRPGTSFARIACGESPVHISDVSADETYRSGSPMRRAMVDLGGARTALWVALRKDSAILGTFVVWRREVRPFTDKQIALLENFAAQAVIAMENARLLGELRERTEEVAELNRGLEARVAEQVEELGRVGRLKRFLAPQLADLIVARGDESILESHRREIVVVFCDLRGFTAFAERAEPEEVMTLLKDYHAALGPIVARFEGTIDHYGGDGIMVFFNDPLPTPEPAKRAIEMALAMREAAALVLKSWRRHGHDIGFGVGIAQGYATLGQIGFAERMDYTAIGTVTNLAARLCAEARDGQILISSRVAAAVEDAASLEEVHDLALKGLTQAVAVYNVVPEALRLPPTKGRGVRPSRRGPAGRYSG